jgi:hypothetical protein
LPTAGGVDPADVPGFSALKEEDQVEVREFIATSPRPQPTQFSASVVAARAARAAAARRRQELIQRIRMLMQRELDSGDYSMLLALDGSGGSSGPAQKKRSATKALISKKTTTSKVAEGEDLGEVLRLWC